MRTMWGVHNDQPQLDIVENGFVSIGWPGVGDLSALPPTREAVKACCTQVYPDARPGKVALSAGVLYRFAHVVAVGDLIVYPHKPDGTVYLGEVTGGYEHHDVPVHPNRRTVRWLTGGIPRTEFSQGARYEIGSAVTLFEVREHADEFRARLGGPAAPPAAPRDVVDTVTETAAQVPDAERIATFTRDFVVDTLLHRLEGVEFEAFTAALLRAMGYRARVTEASGDGGVDVLAHRDPLGLEPPLIKVQCKRTTATVGGPVVRQLIGALSPKGDELGLFVTLGTYSRDAEFEARQRPHLRLVNGTELVELIFEHYEELAPEYRRLLPMRRVYVVDAPADAV